jgi:hypothetical protein
MTSSASTGDSDPRLAYDDLGSPAQMSEDCRAAGANLRLERAVRAAVATPPSIHFEDYPREVVKRDISVDAATARLAAALHLHLD